MRILIINYEYPPIGGGGGFVTRDICENIVSRGHVVTVVTSHFKGLPEHEVVNGVNIIRVPVFLRRKIEVAGIASMLSFFPVSVFKAMEHVKESEYDILNTHFAIPSGPAGYVLSKAFNLPNVLSIHGGDIFDPSKTLSPHKVPILKQTVRIMLNTADCIVAQSNDTKKNAYAYYNIKRPIDIIPLGIKKPDFTKKSRADFNFGDDEIIFCTIGRLVKRKNINDTLAILAELKNRVKFKFLIIGDGPERENLNELANQYSLGSNILMAGNVSDDQKFQLLSVSDIFLSTAVHEGFGLVFLEAMEAGIPIVCYNRGGQNDFLEDGRTGFLVDLGNKNKFKEGVLALINDDGIRSSMGAYNKKIIQNFYIDVCAEKYISLFNKVIFDHSASKRDYQ
jgi:glycosyltransferase involved in cell wall biosynthesis